MNRFILGIGAFILTFGLSFSLVGVLFGFPNLGPGLSQSSASTSSKIARVLDRDIYYGEKRRQDSFRLLLKNRSEGIGKLETINSPEFVEMTDEYVSSSAAINVTGTPADFAFAWNEHMSAWEAHRKLLKASVGSDHDLKRIEETGERITSTYFQVLRIAKRYGVPMKARYYR